MSPIIEVKNLHYVYGEGTPFEHAALADVSFSVERGEFIGIIGHTGSGKSTLMQHLNGLLKPSAGAILLDGEDIWSDKTLTRQCRFRVGLVFQYPEYQLFEETVEKDIAFGPKNLGLEEKEIKQRVKKAMKLMNLDYQALKDVSPFDLSGGQKRKVAIAGVLAMEPEYLILDEPAAGLDPKGREEFLELIDHLHKEGLTVIMVSHSMDDIARYAQRMVVLHQGKLVLEGKPQEVFTHVEELENMGLSVPTLTKLLHALKAKGLPVNTELIEIQQIKAEILRALQERKGEAHA